LNETSFCQHELFERLTQPQRQWLSNRIEKKTFPAKSTIFSVGEPSGELYYIQEGKVKVEVISGKKNWLIKDIYTQHDFFGLNGIVGQQVRREYARTLRSPAEILVLKNSDIQMLMEVNFDFSEKIMTLAANKTLHVEHRISSLYEKSAQARFNLFLLKMIEQEGQFDGENWLLNSQLTQEEIGAYIGTGRQTVTEILNELKSKNILNYNWGRFTVFDIGRLSPDG